MTPFPTMPSRIASLLRDHRGFPVPWFVQYLDDAGKPCMYGHGTPDFRVVDASKISRAVKQNLCWICGTPLGRFKCFTIGPMCCVNRVISEPPAHRECAIYSAQVCPFLSRPRMRRNEKDLPANHEPAAGHHIARNPGAVCVWITKTFKPFRPGAGQPGVLFQLGDPVETLWFANGRPATRDEVMASINSGLPTLLDMAKAEGKEAVTSLLWKVERAMPLVPAAAAQQQV
jgi:hypothetical protein